MFNNFESEFSKVFFGIAAFFYPKLFRITSHAQSSPHASALHPSAPIGAPLIFAPVSVFQLEPSRLRRKSERAKRRLSGRKRDFPAACQRTESLSNVTTGQVAGIKLLSIAVLLSDQEETNNLTFLLQGAAKKAWALHLGFRESSSPEVARNTTRHGMRESRDCLRICSPKPWNCGGQRNRRLNCLGRPFADRNGSSIQKKTPNQLFHPLLRPDVVV